VLATQGLLFQVLRGFGKKEETRILVNFCEKLSIANAVGIQYLETNVLATTTISNRLEQMILFLF